MANQIQVLLTFLLYLFFFGWVGYRRGQLREAIVFSVVAGTWILLQEFGDVLVIIANLGGRFLSIIPTGALTQGDAALVEALSKAKNWIAPENAEAFIFLIWMSLLLVVYLITGVAIKDAKSKRTATAALLGALNGLFYAVVLLPKLALIFLPGGGVTPASAPATASAGTGDILRSLESSFGVVGRSLGDLWGVFETQRSYVLLFLLTILLLTAANTLKGTGAGAKKS